MIFVQVYTMLNDSSWIPIDVSGSALRAIEEAIISSLLFPKSTW